MQNLKPVDLPFGKKTRWFVTHVDVATGHVYCQLSEPSVSVKYERLYQDINVWSKSLNIQERLLNPFIGKICLSESSIDTSWYRSQIAEVDEISKQAEVFFIDYGNSEVVSFEAIRKIPTEFTELPPQSFECILANVEPALKGDKWSDKGIELIKELVLEQELEGIPIRLSKSLLVLKLYVDKDSSITVADQLISAGFGQHKIKSINSSISSSTSLTRASSLSSLEGSVSSRKSSSSTSSTVSKTSLLSKFTKYKVSSQQYIDVCVVFSEGVGKFYCQPVSSKQDLELLQESLQKTYVQNQPLCPKLWNNLPCCVKFQSDNQWYRAMVKDILKGSCSIYFVDFGNDDVVSNKEIFTLDSQYFELPQMAIECALYGVVPLDGQQFSDEANNHFEDLTMDLESMVAYVSNVTDQKVEIVLYDKDNNSVNQKLIQDGFVLSNVLDAKVAGSKSSEDPTSDLTRTQNADVSLVKYVMPSVYEGLQEKVFISYSVNPYCFYINFSSTGNGLQQLMSEINTLYENLDAPITQSIDVGHPCIAKFTGDGQYYRAEVTERSDDSVVVHYVDYGNMEKLNIAELKMLRKEFIKLPKQSVLCKLNGVEPAEENFYDDTCRKFEEICLDKELEMVIHKIDNGYCVVDLVEVTENNKLDVAKTLISSGLVREGKNVDEKVDFGEEVLTEVSFADCKIDVECYLDVAPVHIENPSQFCCHIVQNAMEFKKLTGSLNDHYSNSSHNSKVKWGKLMPCVALYDVDGCWYRATITSISGDVLEVTFIDFGNQTSIPVRNVRPILTEFMKLPVQVFVCTLAGVRPPSRSWTNEACEHFKRLVLDRHLAAYIEEKYENNSYSIVLYDTKTSEKNIGQILIDQNHAKTTNSENFISYVKPESKEKCIVTAVKSLGEFSVQLSRLSPELDQLMEKIYNFYSEIKPTDIKVVSPIIGQYCCSCFTEDDGWYRTCIKEVHGQSLTVEYIDYGNSEHLSIERIKVLNSDFDGIPRFALPCSLQDCEKLVGFTNVTELLLDQEFVVEFCSKEPPYKVELYSNGQALSKIIAEKLHVNKTPTTVATAAVSKETATPNKATSFTKESVAAAAVSKETATPNKATSFTKESVNGTVHPMYFLEATSPHEFYCQPVATETDLSTLMEDISAYAEKKNLQKFKGDVGGLGLAIYKEDGAWYRVKVLEKKKQNLRVIYCDYGNKDVISKDEVFALPPNLSVLEEQAVLCSMTYLTSTSNEWTNGAIEMFNTLCAEKVLNVQVIEKEDPFKLNVTLVDQSTNEDIGQRLVNAGFAKSKTKVADLGKTRHEYQHPAITTEELGYCTQVLTTSVMTVQLQKYEDQLIALMEKLAGEATSCPPLTSAVVGSPCIAVYSEDEQWYRGEIISLKDDKATVRFVDYGNTQVCSLESLKSPSSSMMELPKTCINCILHDVHVEDLDSAKVEEYLNTNVLEQAVNLEFKSQLDVENCSIEVYIYQEGSVDHINDLLYSLFILEESEDVPNEESTVANEDKALTNEEKTVPNEEKTVTNEEKTVTNEEKTVPNEEKIVANEDKAVPIEDEAKPVHLKYSLPSISDKDLGTCTLISSPICLEVQLQKYEDQVIALMEKLAGEATSCLPLTSAVVGSPCIAVYSEDEQWYRGEIISLKDDKATVRFVDYGNTQVCSLESLKSPSSSMTELPKTCINCILYDVHVEDLDSAKIEEYLNTNVLEEAVNLEFKSQLDVENCSIEAYIYQEGSVDHINDLLYSLFILEETEDVPSEEKTLGNKDEALTNEEKTVPIEDEAEPVHLKYSLPSISDKDLGTCTLVSSPICLKVQLQKYEDQVNALMEKLAGEATSCLPLTSAVVGSPCIAVYSEDEQWYRGEIISLKDDKATVRFVDYGNTQVCDLESLKSPSSSMMGLSKTCINCILHDVHVEDLDSPKVEEYLNTNILEQAVNLEFKSQLDVENCSIEAYIYQEGSVDHINDLLYSLFILEESEDVPNEEKTVANEDKALTNEEKTVANEDKTVPIEGEAKPVHLKYLLPSISDKDIGTCTFVSSPICLKVQLQKYEDQVNALMEKLAGEAASCLPLTSAVVGSPCIVVYSEDEQWYRGEIISLKDDKATVRFVDYGNTQVCSLESLKSPSSLMMELPKTCIDCVLHDVHVEDLDSEKAAEYLNTNVLEQAVNLELKSQLDVENCSIEANIYQEGSVDHINDLLYSLFILEESEDVPNEESTVANEDEALTNEEKTVPSEEKTVANEDKALPIEDEAKPVHLKYLLPSISDKDLGTCTFVSSPICLKVQLQKYEDQVNALMEKLAGEATSCLPLTSAVVGSPCIVVYSEDEQWYRGEIISLKDDKATVRFVDYGNTQVCSLESLKSPSSLMMELPKTCLDCVLHDVHVEDLDSEKAAEYLNTNVLEQAVNLELKSQLDVENCSIEANIYQEGSVDHINDLLYSLFILEESEDVPNEESTVANEDEALTNEEKTVPSEEKTVANEDKALPIEDEAKPVHLKYLLPSISDKDLGTCTFVSSPICLKVQLQKYEDQVNALMEKLAGEATSCLPLTSAVVGSPCIVVYSEDEQWYRGEIISLKDDKATVRFVDYGNTQVCGLESLKSPSSSMMELPKTCINCILHDVHVEDLDSEKVAEYLNTNVLEQAVNLIFKSQFNEENCSIGAYIYQEGIVDHINDLLYSLFSIEETGAVSNEVEAVPNEVEAVPKEEENSEDSGISDDASFVIEQPILALTSREIVLCTRVHSAVMIKCQLEKYDEDLNKLCENLSDKLCEDLPDTFKVPNKFDVGSFCLALHREDKLWYRAQILGETNESILVEFIDYGMKETIAKVDTRVLSREFCTLPRCCVCIILNDVHLCDIEPVKTVEWLQESLLKRVLSIDIVSYNENLAVANVFMHGNKTSVNDQIYELFSEDTLSEYVEDNSCEMTDSNSLIDVKDFTQTSIDPSSSMDETVSDFTPLSPSAIVKERCSLFPPAEISAKENILCTFVESATKLSFQLLKYETILNNITELLAEEPEEMFESSEVDKGTGAITKSIQDGNWYRAVVIDRNNENVTVLFIDFGNTEIVPICNLRKITDERFFEPATCITCKLHNVRNIDENNAKEWLEENCVDQIFNAEFINGKNNTKQVVVYFAEKDEKTSINQQLQAQFQMQIDSVVLNRIALKGSNDTVKEKKRKINYLRGTNVETITDENGFSWIVLQKGTLEKATCIMLESAHILYFQLTRLKSKLEKLMSMLENEAEDLCSFRFLEEGTPCIAPYQDMTWHRGKVLSINTGCALVSFVDFGYTDDVITEDIRVIKRPKMIDHPVYCIKCRLAGVSISDANEDDVIRYLRKTLCDNTPEIYLNIVDFNHQEMLADVILVHDDQNINELLQNNYGPCLTLNKCPVKIGDKINVTISGTKSLSSFWCKLSDSASEFADMMDTIQATYSGEEIMTPEHVEVGETYCVRNASGIWNRAQIQEVQDNNVIVLMLDDGTVETVVLNYVRILLPEFYKLKVQGFTATLFDVRPSKHAESWSDDALARFNDICKQDVLTATIMKFHDHERLVTLVTSDGMAVYELLTSESFVDSNKD